MDPEDELCLRIGRIARAHVAIDEALTNVFQALVGPSLALHLAHHQSTSALIHQIEIMLKGANEIEADAKATISAALHAAKEAGTIRNRVVHDMWLRSPNDRTPLKWSAHQKLKGEGLFGPNQSPVPRDLESLDRSLAQMRRTLVQVRGIYGFLWLIMPPYDQTVGVAQAQNVSRREQLQQQLGVVAGRFDLIDGGFRPHVVD